MKVRVLHHAVVPAGTILDLDPAAAQWWVQTGRGERVSEEVETATAAPRENAALRTTKPRSR